MCNSYWCLGVVTCFLLSSYALPQEQDISSQPKNPFDAGAVSSCEVPETRYCADYVTYQVPSSIAWLAVIKDNKISNTIEPMEDDLSDSQCNIEILKETWCKKEFPRCSDSVESNQVLFEAPENCEERLRSSNCVQADSIIKRGFCQSSQSTLHSGSCRTLSSHDQVGELQQCSALGEDVQVSDWMFHYISRVDMELRSGVLVRQTQECWQLYRNFLCGAVGECVGERVRMINTQEMCQAILNWSVLLQWNLCIVHVGTSYIVLAVCLGP